MRIVALAAGVLWFGSACAETPQARLTEQIQTVKIEERPATLVEKGRAYAAIGDDTRAEQYFSAAIDGGGDARRILPLLMRVCVSEGRYRIALNYAEPELRKRPDDYRLRFLVATLYVSIGDAKSAREQLELVTATKPSHADAHYALAVLLRDDMADPVGADTHFREYLRLRPDGPHAAEARGALLKDAKSAPVSGQMIPERVPPKPNGTHQTPKPEAKP